MEFVLFLLAGLLSLAEGQSELLSVEYVIRHMTGFALSFGFYPSPVCSLDSLPFDCQEAYVLGCRRSGVYTIDPGCGKPFSVWCDMNNGGGWTVFQRRRDGSENFYRGWTEYENGFENVKGEHWLGLKTINCLTGARPVAQLRVDMSDFEGHYKNAQYRYFSVGDSTTNYKLRVGGYMAGPPAAAGDSLNYHNGMQFTTRDRDNDRHTSSSFITSRCLVVQELYRL